jgi:hypothetical protein
VALGSFTILLDYCYAAAAAAAALFLRERRKAPTKHGGKEKGVWIQNIHSGLRWNIAIILEA